jgi:hypothetical protein
MPHRKHSYLVSARDIVDVIASSLEEDTTRILHGRLSIQASDLWCVAYDVERCREFVSEQVW